MAEALMVLHAHSTCEMLETEMVDAALIGVAAW